MHCCDLREPAWPELGVDLRVAKNLVQSFHFGLDGLNDLNVKGRGRS